MKKQLAITGGHLTPALAVIEQLDKKMWEPIFFGRLESTSYGSDSVESKVIPLQKIKFVSIPSYKLDRHNMIDSFAHLPLFLKALAVSRKELKDNSVDKVLSFGGYLGLTVSLAALTLGIPVTIHEQTTTPGLANRVTSVFAEKVAISWPDSAKYFPKSKVALTGNPVRKSAFNPPNISFEFRPNRKLPTILVVGGNLGSHAINNLIRSKIEDYLKVSNLIFLTGSLNQFKDYESVVKSIPKNSAGRIFVTKYLDPDSFSAALGMSDFVISRSGANTVTEVALHGLPAIFIPLPRSAGSEQHKNAKLLIPYGSTILEQAHLDPEILFKNVKDCLERLNELTSHAERAVSLVQKDAANKLISLL